MNDLSTFPTEWLEAELNRRKNNKLMAFRETNILKNKKLTSEIVDFLAPAHTNKCGDSTSLLSSGMSYCNRCSLAMLMNSPTVYADVRIGITIDFDLSKQMSFK